MEKLIMMGHSMGATTSLAVCAAESRFKAACVLDPCILPELHVMDKSKLIEIPLLWFISETYPKMTNSNDGNK